MAHDGTCEAGPFFPADSFFTDVPLVAPLEAMWADRQARFVPATRWSGHAIVPINGHCVWKPWADIQPDDLICFYDGDYRDVLAPDDSRILVPREECSAPPFSPHLEWEESR